MSNDCTTSTDNDKVEEDLTLLETIGIIENPKYKDSSKDSKKLTKK